MHTRHPRDDQYSQRDFQKVAVITHSDTLNSMTSRVIAHVDTYHNTLSLMSSRVIAHPKLDDF